MKTVPRFLLQAIWGVLFQEELDAENDFGGYDFNQFLLSRRAVHKRKASYYAYV